MANLNLKFLRGLQANLPSAGTDGYFYLTTDTHRLYTSIDGVVTPVNEGVTTVANLEALASITNAKAGDFFYCTAENILAVYNGQEFVQINPDTGATSVEVVGTGNAVTAATYDPATRKLTLTKGETFATKAYVGTIPNTATATDVIGYVDEKTAGIATDENLQALNTKVTGLENDISAINNTETGILKQAKEYVDAEDKFEVDIPIVSALGGIGPGDNLNGETTHAILKMLLYPHVVPDVRKAVATPNGGTYEKGTTQTITSVSIEVIKKSEAITSVALYNGSTLIAEKTGDAVATGGTFTFSDLNIVVPTNGNVLTVTVTDAKGAVISKDTPTMTFVYPYYMGTCAAGTAINETLVESLTKQIVTRGTKSNSFTVSNGHMVFAYPKSYGALASILDPNNFETIGNYTEHEVSVTGLDGTAQTYYVYVSGATTVSDFNVTFKYQ